MTAAQIDGDPPPGAGPLLGHHALVYSSEDDFLRCALEYVRRGIEQDDAVIVATPRAAELTAALGSLADRVEVVDERFWHRVPAWTIGGYARRAERSARGGHRLRVLTELRWDDPETRPDWESYEAVVNTALAGLPVDLCCAYDTTAVDGDVLDTAHRTHPSTIGAAGVEASASYVPAADFLAARPPRRRLAVPSDAMRLEFGAAEIPAVRQATLGWARAAGMAEDAAQEFLIAIYEIASNAVEHGGGRGVGRFWANDGRLCCDVWSAEPIVNSLIAGYRPPGTAQERGRGLWLARQICERVTIWNENGATVQLVRSIASD
ncbi:sensor histidine kinase [Cryptosporangium aurantiacum]|uniref:Anti-sigma regulatory factor (Ser/Thr protein kinase) n=1 Tax=Cryptosporangium aurantiacum TaxID=134849 RepID=A0A1M7QSP4_9ACTN|nr:sensor histidine kinase [Cryptosporangium aurantiacum]SHN34794.1 Anti-sigma regulatory factor (Ser/Thr protein kinase) [Cryptosporangium aurantiacum]